MSAIDMKKTAAVVAVLLLGFFWLILTVPVFWQVLIRWTLAQIIDTLICYIGEKK